jgi:poly(A) polymerase
METPAALGYRYGPDAAASVVLARAAVLEMPLADGWEEDAALGVGARFPVTAADLMPTLSGPALGERLAVLEARWIASGFLLTRDDLLG